MSGWFALLVCALAAGALHARDRQQLVRAARAGHEVRGPLCTAQLALDGLAPSARVEAIAFELRRAALALDDLSGRARESIEPVDIGRLLSDATHAWRALADANGVRLTVEPVTAFVRGDRLRLAQACANLVANAIEHGSQAPPAIEYGAQALPAIVTRLFDPSDLDPARPRLLAVGGDRSPEPPVVEVRSSAVAGRVLIEVRDFGPGLPAPLSQLLAAARGRRSPRGHGLAIAAAVAERHGGRLVAFPAERGAHLVLDLPSA